MKKKILNPNSASENHPNHGASTAGIPTNHQTQDYCHESGDVGRDEVDGDGFEHLLEQLPEPPLYCSKKAEANEQGPPEHRRRFSSGHHGEEEEAAR
jgi:hypothetical protein